MSYNPDDAQTLSTASVPRGSHSSAYFTDQAAWLSRLRLEIQPVEKDPEWHAKEMAQYHLLGAASELRKIANAMARRESARPEGEVKGRSTSA
jgi:hypothetical protein